MSAPAAWWRSMAARFGQPRRHCSSECAGRSSRLHVLMYHKVLPVPADPWTVSPEQLAAQLDLLITRGHTAIACRQIIEHLDSGRPLPDRPVLITFDDGYVNNLTHALPVLRERGLRATLFVPTGYLGLTNQWDQGQESLLGEAALRSLDEHVFEVGLHSHRHQNYRGMTIEQIADDLRQCVARLRAARINAVPAIAYPYGGFPRGRARFRDLERMLASQGMRCGFRIGNRPNRLPLRERFRIERIDVRRDDDLVRFERKLDRAARWLGTY